MSASELRVPGHPGAGRDPGTISRYQRLVELYAKYYRPEVRGFENLPKSGPFLVVGNHSGGATPPDMPILLTAWWRERGVDEPIYGLFHSFFLGLPGVRAPLTQVRRARGGMGRGGGGVEQRWDRARLPRRWRLKVMPIMVGPPWVVSFGLPTIPLPVKATVQLCPPLDLAADYGFAAADDERIVQEAYERITTVMQKTLDGLAAERR